MMIVSRGNLCIQVDSDNLARVPTVSSPQTEQIGHVLARKSRFYRPELDLLRFLAFLMVFFHHGASGSPRLAFLASPCASGLQIFFFLSSYLITELLLQEREKTGTVHVRAFFVRRILRIWPLYFFIIGTCFLLTRTTHRFGTFSGSAVTSYLLLSGNWWVAAHGWLANMLGPLWSISLEEQYYLIWPFIGRSGHKIGLWIASCIALLSAYGVLFHLGAIHAPRYSVWANSFVEFQFFAFGAIGALVLHEREFRTPAWLRGSMLLVGGGLIAVAYGLHIMTDVPSSVRELLLGYPSMACGVVLIFLSFYNQAVPSWCSPLLYLGRISYGLYVFHYLALRVGEVGRNLEPWLSLHGFPVTLLPGIRMVFSLFFCIGLAALSHRYLEQPFLRLKNRFTFIRTRTN